MNWKLIIVIALIAYGGYQYFAPQPVHRNKTTATPAPAQKMADERFKLNGYTISPIEPFEIEARVLSSKHYRFDREADLSPVDLALGWGKMADEAVLKKFSIVQKGRFYFWRAIVLPLSRKEIEASSANMHMVPANREIEETLKRIKAGQTVSIKGALINVDAEDGWHWTSSLTRNDTGKGACELVYVEQLLVH